LAQGVLGTIRGIAAAIGTGSVGFIVQHFGDFTGFLLKAIGPAVAAALIWAFLRETKPELMRRKAAFVAALCRRTWMIRFNRYTHEGTAGARPRFHGTTGAIIRVRPRTAPV
jgi:hypothetical protein